MCLKGLARPVLFLIRLYRMVIRPVLPSSCRFYPSCSEYALDAIQSRGLGRGLMLATWRLCRCHPFAKGGVDLVPYEKNERVY